jgi:hypothetical protein
MKRCRATLDLPSLSSEDSLVSLASEQSEENDIHPLKYVRKVKVMNEDGGVRVEQNFNSYDATQSRRHSSEKRSKKTSSRSFRMMPNLMMSSSFTADDTASLLGFSRSMYTGSYYSDSDSDGGIYEEKSDEVSKYLAKLNLYGRQCNFC